MRHEMPCRKGVAMDGHLRRRSSRIHGNQMGQNSLEAHRRKAAQVEAEPAQVGRQRLEEALLVQLG